MISTNLRFLRKLQGYSQEEVAEKVNVARQAIAKWGYNARFRENNRIGRIIRCYSRSHDSL